MKLNLLPKTVDTTSRAKGAFVGGLLIFIGSLVAAGAMAKISSDRLAKANTALEEVKPLYDNAVKVATEADTMMSAPQVKQVVTNAELAAAMIKANALYPDFYDSVKGYIPAFFRITAMSASAVDDKTSTLNLTGTVKNAQEYADLMLALLRIPGATSVSRGGFSAEDVTVPALTVADQTGRPRKASEAPIPDDAVERLEYFSNQTYPTGYLASGGFGETEVGTTKTVRPNESLINVSVTVPKDLRVPNPRATIQTLGAAPAAPASTAAAPAPGAGATPPGDRDL